MRVLAFRKRLFSMNQHCILFRPVICHIQSGKFSHPKPQTEKQLDYTHIPDSQSFFIF